MNVALPKAPVQTNWIAIIGAPSAGKSSVIDELAARGYTVEQEVARAYIEERIAAGETLEDVRGPDSVQNMQREIFARAVARDQQLDPAALIFFDRGNADQIFYFSRAGLDPAPVREVAQHYRYRAVFLLQRLPLEVDNIRTEDDAAAQQMQDAFLADYRDLGYDVIIVPVMDIAARADFILTQLAAPALSTAGAMT